MDTCLPAPELEPTDLCQAGPLAYVDVFVDDFMQLVQGSRRRRKVARRILMHTIDELIEGTSPDHPMRKEPLSVSKLQKGDGSWTTRKVLLGWILDTLNQTLELPPHRMERIKAIFDALRGQRRVSVKKWQKVLGELRFVSVGIPGSAGLFSALQLGLQHADQHRIRVTRHVRNHLDEFESLVLDLGARPTRLGEIVPDLPRVMGATDASKLGMGGVFFAEGLPPKLWRAPYPPDIQAQVVSTDNPMGALTNSDLEQSALTVHHDVVCNAYDVRELTVSTCSDNTPAVSRLHKGSLTTDKAAAYLCRLQSSHQRHHRYCPEVSYIPGPANAMADDCSRLLHLTDTELLSRFDTLYPQNKLLDNMPADQRNPFLYDLGLAQEATRHAVVESTRASRNTTWDLWTDFCDSINVPHSLRDIDDALSPLQVFCIRYRRGDYSQGHKSVRAGTVSKALLAVGKGIQQLVDEDPRKLSGSDKLHWRLADLLKAFKRFDPPSERRWPVNATILQAMLELHAPPKWSAERFAAAKDLATMAYFFLLRPIEYSSTTKASPKTTDSATTDSASATNPGDRLQPDPTLTRAFTLQDAYFSHASRQHIPATTSDLNDVERATFVSLYFTDQKNGQKGEYASQSTSGVPTLCPVHATRNRVQHLLAHSAPPDTALYQYYGPDNKLHNVTSRDITHILRLAAKKVESITGIPPYENHRL